METIAPFRISVCGIEELQGHCETGVSHVLSILDPDWPVPEAFGDHALVFALGYLVMRMAHLGLYWVASLEEAEVHVAVARLLPTTSAATLRKDDPPLVLDGPFAETKEQLAGFYLIEARDLNEAIQVAAKIPPARVGSIEVRPVRELKAE